MINEVSKKKILPFFFQKIFSYSLIFLGILFLFFSGFFLDFYLQNRSMSGKIVNKKKVGTRVKAESDPRSERVKPAGSSAGFRIYARILACAKRRRSGVL